MERERERERGRGTETERWGLSYERLFRLRSRNNYVKKTPLYDVDTDLCVCVCVCVCVCQTDPNIGGVRNPSMSFHTAIRQRGV